MKPSELKRKKKALLEQQSLCTLCEEMLGSATSEEEKKTLEEQLSLCKETIEELIGVISGSLLPDP